jgi:hypothetical protein
MLRDVFYYGKKPNVHPREKFATSLEDARSQCTTEHFWIINEYCDYRNFDWDFDFEFLPDEDVWAEEHNNIWPSTQYSDSGTWLCPEKHSDINIYRADVEPISYKNEKHANWVLLDLVDETKFDFSWHPDPHDPPYIYAWGCKYYPVEVKACIEYRVPGATAYKYMKDVVELLPNNNWVEVQKIDKSQFDLSWKPDPREPAFIYVWGNKHIAGELQSTLEYHVPGATEYNYVGEVDVLPEWDRWKLFHNIDKSKFDLTWRPDPREPAYIYTWGNKYDPAEVKPTVEYHVPGATEHKYMDIVDLEPEWDRWKEIQPVDKTKFDFSWRPDPNLHEPPYIYVWGNKYESAEVKPTLEYHVPGATEYKYMDIVDLEPQWDRWKEIQPVDKTKFDFSWRPDPNLHEPPYIYVWGNKHIPAELKSTIEYHVPGATEYKYMPELVDVLPELDRWKEIQSIDRTKFDLSWRPDPREPAFIYVWGNKHIPGELKSTIEYHCPEATERKYMEELVEVLPEQEYWKVTQEVKNFDFTWRPDPREPAYIYTWGNKHIAAELKPTIEYYCEGATERKYMGEVDVAPEMDRWNIVHEVQNFDFSWRPDPREPAFIYVWGNKYDPAEVKSTIEYHVPGATEYKYMDIVELAPEWDRWKENIPVDHSKFDFTWRPDPNLHEPPYIYVWGNKHIAGELKSTLEYHVPNATERKYMSELVEVLPEFDKWNIVQQVDNFDFSWRPDPREPAYIYTWGNKYISAELNPTIEFHCEGATERKYMGNVDVAPEWDRYQILIPVDKNSFDFSWRPDPREPAFIYVWGNQCNNAVKEPTVEYHCPGATERKYMDDKVARTSPTVENWKTLIPVDIFDYGWRPDPDSPPYIYIFGNQWHDGATEPTIEYHTPGATDKKYITSTFGLVKSTATDNHWKRLIPIESFDYSWRPDPNSPPYIYVFGNKWNDANTEPSVEYHVEGATEYKYMTEPVAVPKADLQYWSISNNDDLETFDFSWRPNPYSPPQIYQWQDNGPRYTVVGATEVVLMEHTGDNKKSIVNRYPIKTTLDDLVKEHPEEVFWAINPDLNYDKFDFSWRPNQENFRHINVFGNEYSKDTQTYYINGPMYIKGHKEYNYVEGQTVQVDSNLSMFFIDRSNSESNQRFEELKLRYPQLQKTRYLNSWVDTITRCINKSETKLFWVLNSELDYSNFEFDFYPSPWQMKMIHVFGTQWSHWGTTFMVNRETFIEDTKYVKIIEHLSMLNFVKSKKAKAVNRLYDIVYIDHGNEAPEFTLPVTTIKFDTTYLKTFTKLLRTLPEKKEHYIWVCSSVCDYSNFDFSYICDPFAKEQLHVFSSDKQKFGDTFLIDVNKLRSLIKQLKILDDYTKIDFNQSQRVKRLPAPVIVTEGDSHVSSIKTEFNFPYAVFVTEDNKNVNVIDHEPMSLWSPESRNIQITSKGGTRIVVPKEAKDYVKKELYDYPYIMTNDKLVKSNPLDIVFFSNGEASAESNYEHLLNITKGLPNKVVRIDGVSGRVNSQHAAANSSTTPWYFLVNAKLKVDTKFDFDWQPDRLQIPKHYIFHATNPVNGLVYGHQAIVANNKKLTLANFGTGLDFTMDSEHEVVEVNSGTAMFNTSEWDTWRTAFRECIKLKASATSENEERLDYWLNVGLGKFAQYSLDAAQHAVEYYDEVNGDFDKLRLSYDWPWLRTYYETKYKL